jgi:hypothetical protein
MESTNNVNDRVLARVTAADLSEVVGGQAQYATCTITGPAQENINGSDITNTGGDED